MREQIKKYLLYAVLAAGVYFLLAYHYIYCGGTTIKMIKKPEPNLHYTFFSIENKRPESIMAIDVLRENGIGDLLVEMGRISESEKNELEEEFDN
jgi:hypothetical protein